MLEYIDAPIPYIVGISRSVWKEMDKAKKQALEQEIIIYDIDKKKLKCCHPLPTLPEVATSYIHSAIAKILENKKETGNVNSFQNVG